MRDLVQGVAAETDRVEAELLKMPEENRPTLESRRPEIRKAAWTKQFCGWDEGDWSRLTTTWLGYSK